MSLTSSITMHVATLSLAMALAPAGAAQCPTELDMIITNDGQPTDSFGASIAVSGNLLLVGAPGDDGPGGKINSGSAYVFDATLGTQIFKIAPGDLEQSDEFGSAVALDGTLAAVGTFSPFNGLKAGAVYLFNATTTEQLHKLQSPNVAHVHYFGLAVAVEGNHVLVGAPGANGDGLEPGEAYLFDAVSGALVHTLVPPDLDLSKSFGVAVDIEGDLLIVGAWGDDEDEMNSGAAYLFDANTGAFLRKLKPNDPMPGKAFGRGIALVGSTAIIGAVGESTNGTSAGAVYAMDTTTGAQLWKSVASDGAGNDRLGRSLSADGSLVTAGARQATPFGSFSGAAYVFDFATGAELYKLTASNGAVNGTFGISTATVGSELHVGSYADSGNGQFSGTVYKIDVGTPFVPETYCTAKATSIPGCVPTISFRGTVGVTTGPGFEVVAGPVPGNNFGMFLYSTAAAGTPIMNAFGNLCVNPGPGLFRIGTQLGGGTNGTCSGEYSVDFSLHASTQMQDPSLVPGATVEVQAWYRDPANVGSANLTNAGRFVYCQ